MKIGAVYSIGMTDDRSRMGLAAKASLVILLIVGLSAVAMEAVDRYYVQHVIQEHYQDEVMGVVRQVGAGITARTDFANQSARELELVKLRASRPDLVNISIYALSDLGLSLLAHAGQAPAATFAQAPPLAMQAIEQDLSLSDRQSWATDHRLKITAPISVDGRRVGAAYAEFSTLDFDNLLDLIRRLSFSLRLLTWLGVVLAINFFVYLAVHRPTRSLLSAVKAVTSGNLTTTVPVASRDEIGMLGQEFNRMVERIRLTTEENAHLYEKVKHANESLVRKVREATAELRQKNQELARTNELLSTVQREAARAQRLSVIGQLAASVAHKIGTPLTALSGHIQLLQEDPQLSAEARARLRTVEAQIDRTIKIIQDLLIYARRPELVKTILDVNESMQECLALLRPEMDRRKVDTILQCTTSLGKVEGDQQQLQEVFCNLIENALDAMPKGGTLTIRTAPTRLHRAGEMSDQVAIEIADTGQGIAPEHTEKIFEPFFTTKTAGRGTGLGLAIAHDTVKAHGGAIHVHSELGKGTHFQVLLPIAKGVPDAGSASRPGR
ncbi:MAG: ATP-binding protein [Nitrospiraceae bacterium]